MAGGGACVQAASRTASAAKNKVLIRIKRFLESTELLQRMPSLDRLRGSNACFAPIGARSSAVSRTPVYAGLVSAIACSSECGHR